MMKKLYICFSLLVCLGFVAQISAQSTSLQQQQKIEVKRGDIPELDKAISITVSQLDIQDFIRGVGNKSGMNIAVDPDLKLKVTNNYTNTKVSDIVLYLCERYNLDFHFIGNILTIYKQEEVLQAEEESVLYDRNRNLLTINYSKEAPVGEVVKKITKLSGKNIILTPKVKQKKVSGYIQKLTFDVALNKFFYSNQLQVDLDPSGVYVISDLPVAKNNTKQVKKEKDSNFNIPDGVNVNVVGDGLLDITAEEVEISEIIKVISWQLGKDVALVTELKGKMDVFAKAINYEDVLNLLLENTPYDFKVQNGVYVLGERKSPVFEKIEIYRFQNRRITNIIESIPADIKKDLELNENPELNSIIISGPENQTAQLISFFEKIDQSVPLILIELIIVDMSKSFAISTGISAGIGEAPQSTGQVFPEYNRNLSTTAINNLLASFQTPGARVLGKVGPDFYLQLKAMETQGILKINSTPRLATLNSHEATMSIGRTEYYQEQRSNIIGSQNPQVANSIEYKSVDAALDLTIIPIVSGNDQITIELNVNQSDFTERIAPLAPPGTVNRTFQSMIRVKNEEMILLGGLEQKRNNDTGSGVPFISRIPIIKWFFSSREKSDTKSRLSVFIKPTIIN